MNPSSTPHHHHQPPLFFPHASQYPNSTSFLHPPPPPSPSPILAPTTTTTTAATATSPPLFISTALSSLSHLLSLSHRTFTSLPPSLSPHPPHHDVPCPYNPHHLMPAHSLFLHSLNCPSPLLENPSSLLHSLHYPTTLNPPKNPIPTNPPIQDPLSTEFSFSLDTFYNEFASNFFYKDCPGAVSMHDLHSLKKTFTMPSAIFAECENCGNSGGEGKGFDKNEFKVMPSGLWGIRREVEGWVDYPSVYSYSVFCAILRLNSIKGNDLRRWIITSSLRYGVVIDVYLRDHLYALFRLCLKAIRREALGFVGCEMNGTIMSFKCLVLHQALTWTVSQLSVLYGEVNAKSFAIHVFKQCVFEAANKVVLFPMNTYLEESSGCLDANGISVKDVKLKEPIGESAGCKVGEEQDETVDAQVILLSQVAASVAALHERSLLELKIKALRFPQPLPRYQRMTEHTYISMGADEVRKQRPNYRGIIEHDGLLRKQSSNQETGKTKTREELLAEERDYKRRRMSYRGKKLKRTTLQVMRDIIDEYMEEIKQAGGIGFLEKGDEEEGISTKLPSARDVAMDFDGPRRQSYFPEPIRDAQNYYREPSHSDDNIRSASSKDTSTQDYAQEGQGYHRRHEHKYQRKNTVNERHGRVYSGSPERHRSHGRSYEWGSHQTELDDVEQTRSKDREKSSSGKSKFHDYESHSVQKSSSNFRVQKDGQKLDVRDGHRGNYGNYSSNVLSQDSFEDRYDPRESHDTYEGDVYTTNKYVRPEDIRD